MSVFSLMYHRFVIPVCCLFRPCHSRSCQIWGYCLQQMFRLMCLGMFCLLEVTRCGPGLNRLVSGDASDGNRLLVTTSACTLTCGLMCCDWLHSACGSSNQRESVHRCCRLRRLGGYQWKFCGSGGDWCSEFWCVSSCRPVYSAGIPQRCSSRLCKVTMYIACGTMASVDAWGSRPEDDRSGSIFVTKCKPHGMRRCPLWTCSRREW